MEFRISRILVNHRGRKLFLIVNRYTVYVDMPFCSTSLLDIERQLKQIHGEYGLPNIRRNSLTRASHSNIFIHDEDKQVYKGVGPTGTMSKGDVKKMVTRLSRYVSREDIYASCESGLDQQERIIPHPTERLMTKTMCARVREESNKYKGKFTPSAKQRMTCKKCQRSPSRRLFSYCYYDLPKWGIYNNNVVIRRKGRQYF